jgi:hypothetical protein
VVFISCKPFLFVATPLSLPLPPNKFLTGFDFLYTIDTFPLKIKYMCHCNRIPFTDILYGIVPL